MIELLIPSVTAFMVSTVCVYLRAWQQLNVFFRRYKPIMLVSMLLALCEVAVIGLVVKTSFWLFIPIGLGGGIGCLIAMRFNHSKPVHK